MPKDNFLKGHIRTFMLIFDDLVPLLYQSLSKPSERAALKQKIIEKMLFFVKYGLSVHYKKGGYFMGDELTLIDFHILPFLERYEVLGKHYLGLDFTTHSGLELLAEYYSSFQSNDLFIKSTLPAKKEDGFDRKEYLIKSYQNYFKE